MNTYHFDGSLLKTIVGCCLFCFVLGATPAAASADDDDAYLRAILKSVLDYKQAHGLDVIVQEQAEVAAFASLDMAQFPDRSERFDVSFVNNVYNPGAMRSSFATSVGGFGEYFLAGMTVDAGGNVYFTNDLDFPCNYTNDTSGLCVLQTDPLIFKLTSTGQVETLANWCDLVQQTFDIGTTSSDRTNGRDLSTSKKQLRRTLLRSLQEQGCDMDFPAIHLRDISVDSSGALYVTEPLLNAILRVGPAGPPDVEVFAARSLDLGRTGPNSVERPAGSNSQGCFAQPISAVCPDCIIPDDGSGYASAFIVVSAPASPLFAIHDLRMVVDIDHPSALELNVQLIHQPSGISVQLLELGDVSAGQGFYREYDGDDLAVYKGMINAGTWELRVEDVIPFNNATPDAHIRCFKLEFDANPNQSDCLVGWPGLGIPQNGTPATVTYTESRDLPIAGMRAHVSVRHDKIGDLTVDLRHEDTGTVVRLHNMTGGMTNDLLQTYTNQLNPFIGESTLGNWTLIVRDNINDAGGPLNNRIRCFWLEFDVIPGFKSHMLQGPMALERRRGNDGVTQNLVVVNQLSRNIVEFERDDPLDPDRFPESASIVTNDLPLGPTIDPLVDIEPPWSNVNSSGELSLAPGLDFQRIGFRTTDIFFSDPVLGLYRVKEDGTAVQLLSNHKGSVAFAVNANGQGGNELFAVRNAHSQGAFDGLTFQGDQVSETEQVGNNFAFPILIAHHPNSNVIFVAETRYGNVFRLTPRVEVPDLDVIVTGRMYSLESLEAYLIENPQNGSLIRRARRDGYETWEASGNMFITGRGAGLQIQPGQQLLFRDGKRLEVRRGGRLLTQGRSLYEGNMSVGADACRITSKTGFDTPALARAGLWQGVVFRGDLLDSQGNTIRESRLMATIIDHAVYGVEAVEVPETGPLDNLQSFLDLRFCEIRQCHSGVFVRGSSPLLMSTQIHGSRMRIVGAEADPNTGFGVIVENTAGGTARPLMFNCDVTDNDVSGVFVKRRQARTTGPSARLGRCQGSPEQLNSVSNIGHNNFHNNGLNIINGVTSQLNAINFRQRSIDFAAEGPITAQCNFWGVTTENPAAVRAVIDDFHDNPQHGEVIFTGFVTEPNIIIELDIIAERTSVQRALWNLYE